MNAEKYVNQIVKKIRCSGKRRKLIKQDLLNEIHTRLTQGASLEDVISQMGNISEVANSFNENISEEERKRYTQIKIARISLALITVILAIIAVGIIFLPHYSEINHSKIFDKDTVNSKIEYIIEKLDANEYAALQDTATEQMLPALTEKTMQEAKASIADHWGSRTSMGQIYITEVSQSGKHYAISQVTVGYEKISVTYTITLDEKLKLAGLYMK